jgi:DNA polymerase/3'-5' exonuclease PolX
MIIYIKKVLSFKHLSKEKTHHIITYTSNMNSTSITDYILKLEKENEQLKELYRNSEATLEKLNSKILDESIQRVGAVLNEPSLYDTTARTKTHTLNKEIAEHLKELGEMTSDFYKAAAYNTAADTIATLDFEVHNGESLLEIKGIGKGISTKVDQFLDEYFDDSESVASTDGQIIEESDDETDSDDESDFFISYNSELADVLDSLAYYEKDEHKSAAYDHAANIIDKLPFKVTSGKELAKGLKKVKGIGKSIANVIDEFLSTGKVQKLERLEKGTSTNEEVARALEDYADDLEDPFKIRAYTKAAEVIRKLDYEVTCGEELAKGPKKVKGIGKSIAAKIDKFLQTGVMKP